MEFSLGVVDIGVCIVFLGGIVVWYPTLPLRGPKFFNGDAGVEFFLCTLAEMASMFRTDQQFCPK